PKNTHFPDILVKVCVLNDLYATGILDTFKVAEHVSTIKELDSLLQAGRPEAIDLIRCGHGIETKSKKDRDFYSFATKYCSFHNPDHFPIWDNLVSDLIYRWNKHYGWNNSLTHDKLHRYPIFIAIIKSILEYLNDRSLTVKSLDMGLWIIGKYVFRKKISDKDKNMKYIVDEFEKRIGKAEGN
ncbi:MAG: hypothetical protein JW891_17445, partial [Candidatus Lokiarchaeota archaeon]|nr:hypothetical protein [Candidatus Lokiarchaeota archaeon]